MNGQPIRTATETGRAVVAALALGLVAGGALVFAIGERRNADAAEERAAIAERRAFEERLAALEAQQRTLASLALLQNGNGAPDRDRAEIAADERPATYAATGSDALAGKPVEADAAGSRQRTGVEDSAMARALERADRLAQAITPAAVAAPVAAEGGASGAAPTGVVAPAEGAPAEPPPAAVGDDAAVIVAFNELLAAAGLERWRLLAATAQAEDRALLDVVLAERGVRGVATGSLVARKLVLERDPITGLAAFVATEAHGIEAGVEVHYEGGRYRIEIPGVLPVALVAPRLRQLFGLGIEGTPEMPLEHADGAAAVSLANRALALEKNVGLRLRSVEKLDGDRLLNAIIDLAFDADGKPEKSVHAEVAWFEIDPEARHGELFCEGGGMVEGGQRRPLYRDKLTIPMRDLTPEHWKGVPAVRRVARG